jgi:hypothetical protein
MSQKQESPDFSRGECQHLAKRHILILVSNPESLEGRVLDIKELLNFGDRELAEAARRILLKKAFPGRKIVELGSPFTLGRDLEWSWILRILHVA